MTVFHSATWQDFTQWENATMTDREQIPPYDEDLVEELAHRERNLSAPEPLPNESVHPAVWDLVIKDMQERDRTGFCKYRTRLKPFNGRDALIDAYQEALDLVVYLRQEIYERDNGGTK